MEMTPFLLSFAERLDSRAADDLEMPATTELEPGLMPEPRSTRFTRVRQETTDDE